MYLISIRIYLPISHRMFFLGILFTISVGSHFLIPLYETIWLWLLPIYITLILGTISLVMTQRYTAKKYQSERRFELYDLMRQFHHSKEGMKQLNHLDLYFNNIQHMTSNEKNKMDFYKNLKSFRSHTIPLIRQLLNEGKRLGLPLSQVRQIERNLKSCQYILKLRSTPKLSDRTIHSLSLSIRKIKSEVAVMRKSVEKLFVSDLFEVLNSSVAKFHQFTEIAVLNPAEQQSLKVIILPEELAQVFSNLFENSLRAMANKRDKRLRITVEPSFVEKVTIKIRDDGKGISPSQQKLIFEETFSTKGSTGLGLFHARQLLRRYGGEVELLHSAPGKGAVFQI